MKKILIMAILVVSTAHANTVQFDCVNAEKHTLKIVIDDSLLVTKTSSPKFADIFFVFDGSNYSWKQMQYLSLPMATGETATEFRYDAVNTLYIQYSPKKGDAEMNLTVERNSFDFECVSTRLQF